MQSSAPEPTDRPSGPPGSEHTRDQPHDPPTLEFLETDWNEEFAQRANDGHLTRVRVVDLRRYFDKEAYAELMRIGGGVATDTDGKRWALRHLDDTVGLAFLEALQ